MITLRLLGGASLEGPDAPLTGRVAQRRPLALLALLAVDRARAISRDRLLLLLAPELDTDRARHLLRDTVYAIRNALGGDVIQAAGDELRIERSLIRCDVWDFEAALDRGEVEAAGLLRGGRLMEGFHLPESPEFDAWVAAERARLDAHYATALELAAEAAAGQGDHQQAVRRWTARAALDPASAAATLGLMRALAAAGDVTGAIRQAGIHAGFLRSEFGDGPDPGVEALAERLRHGRVTAAAAQPVPRADPPAAVVDTTPVTAPAEQRPGRSRRIALAAVAVLLALVTIAWVRAARKPALEPRRVAVAPFENGTGDPALDALGGMVADWVVDGLVRTGLVEVVPVATSIGVAGRSAPGGGGGDVVRALSVGTGARFVVHGTFYRVDGRLHLQGRISDAGRGVVVRALGPFVAEQNLPLPALDSLRQQALVGLAPFVDSRLEATATAASAPPSFPAYRNYADGLEAFVAGELDRAIDRFDRAVALDSGYTHARVWAALARWNSGDHAGADSVIRTVDTTGAPLAPLDEAIRRSVLAWAAGDWAAAYEMAVRGARAAPGSGLAAAQTAVEARRLGRPAEARRTLAALDPDRGDLRGWIYYWQDLAEARHLLGDHRAEWRDAEEARRRYPDHEATRLIQLRALAALGRGEAVTSVLEQVRTGAVERFFGRLSREAAAELLVHGHPEAAARVVEDGVRWYRERSGGSPSAAQILGLVRLMMVLPGNDQEAWALLAPTPPPENPRSAVDHAGLAALLAQRVGDEAGASERLQRIGALEVPMLNGRDEWWISAVLATRGDCRAAVASLARARSRGVEYGIELHNAAELTALRRCEGAGRVLGAVD